MVFKRNQAAISILKEVFAMNETDYNARLYEKMKADWQEDGVKVSKGAKSLSILEPVEYAKKDGTARQSCHHS